MRRIQYQYNYIKMKHLKFYLVALVAILAFPSWGQSRGHYLHITVTAPAGESLEGQGFVLEQVISDNNRMSYPSSETVLDAEGKCTVDVYGGNHCIRIERAGFVTYEKTFAVTADMTLDITLQEAVSDPFSLKTEVKHDIMTGGNNVTLSWNREDPAFFDDFEGYEAFAIEFGDWTGIDDDGAQTAVLSGTYQNQGKFQYAQIINPLTGVTPPWYYEYPVLRAYSGNQYVGFIRTQTGVANDDWLISPAIEVGTDNILRFMAKSADQWDERFQVGITTELNPTADDFVFISSGNYETTPGVVVGSTEEDWITKTYDLSEYAGETVKIAIRYISQAVVGNGQTNAFMLMVDDFYVGQPDYYAETVARAKARRAPVMSPANPNERFEIYKNGEKVGETDDYYYVLENLPAGNYTLGVKALYREAESNTTETQLAISDGDYVKATFRISTNNNASPEGMSIGLTATETGEAYSVTATGEETIVPSLPKGEYVIGVVADNYEPFSQTVKVDGDMEIPISLVERIIDPYNITVDCTENADGSVDAVVKWNQDLGFSDSFESYEDFSTGEFGDWISLDEDGLPTYPIALQTGELITYPGSATVNASGQVEAVPIAPMVFNPFATKPAMAPADVAVMAPDGNKSVIFNSSQMATADKWLISPEMTVRDGYVWTFYAKAYASLYPETMEFHVSTEGAEPADFALIDQVTLPSEYWGLYSIDLSGYAGETVRLGFRYTSTDAFFAQVDNVYIGPSDDAMEDVGDVLKYEVYLDGVLKGTVEESSYTFEGISAGEHTVGVKAFYVSGESAMTEYKFNTHSGVASISGDDVAIAGGKGVIRIAAPCGLVEVYNLAGQLVATSNVDTEQQIAVPAGVYVVKTAGKTTKVVVY